MRLTRSQVAQRLGRSIATVRKMEQRGTLTPALGQGGKRLFEFDEVEEASERAESTGRALAAGHELQRHLGETVEALRRQIMEQTQRIAESKAREDALILAHETLHEELIDTLADFVEVARPRNQATLVAIERLIELVK